MSHQKELCKNCDASVDGNYCATCGQRTTIAKITIKDTFQEIMNMFFSVNAPLMVTLKYAIINPGKLFREFIHGKRKTYYKPVAFFILMTIVYVIVNAILKYDPIHSEMIKDATGDMESLAFRSGKFMRNNITNFLFFFVFSFGISLKLFFRKHYSLAEYFAVAFYLTGMYTLLISCLMYLISEISVYWRPIPFLIMLLYFLYAITSFFQSKQFLIFLKGIIAYIFAVVLYILFSFGLSMFIISFS
ncbi:DUF3667 domain-containing protein [Kordia sp. YSTF-M3]|uniref:DUF3667 domain-containing protein n=1 Tax=Kordia aestuariivivens TaxID=2759037 RepID=A0ABR7Q3R5_9FLAO|nr:DUF3667 domain-containing protein [Kordia aestuariivivens]MBC8753185.1 DUF3667 domain-containing protein [Kordia aestuariivivens]